MAASTNRRALMIGLDSLEVTLLDRLLAEGRLPNLKAFSEASHRLEVRSEGDPLHGSVWPSFATGLRSGSHGIYFWLQWLEEEMAYVRNSHPALDNAPWWQSLVPTGRTATIVDVPYVSLVDAPGFRGVMGWGLHDEVVPVSSPPSFEKWIVKTVGKSPLVADTMEPQSPRQKLQMTRDMRRSLSMRARFLSELVRDRQWDLLVVTFSEIHKVGHYLAAPEQLSPKTTNVDALLALLRPFDNALPGLVADAGDDCDVVLFALHGMQHQADFSAYGNQILDLVEGREPQDPDAHPDLLRRVRNRVPLGIRDFIWHRLPPGLRAAREGARARARSAVNRAPIFAVPMDGDPSYRANIRGRERDGVIDAAEADDYFRRIEEMARRFTADDGQPAYLSSWRASIEAPGARSHRLPDLILRSNGAITHTSELRRDDGLRLTSQRPEARNGDHIARGFAFMKLAGGSVARDEVDGVDFGPTMLARLRVEPLSEMDGKAFSG